MQIVKLRDKHGEIHEVVVNGGTKREDAICAGVTNYLVSENGWVWMHNELKCVSCEGNEVAIALKGGDVMRWEVVE